MSRNILVLWRWSEALACEGQGGTFSSIGGQMRAVKKADRLFICATTANELYLLGLLRVTKVRNERRPGLRSKFGKYRALCRNLGGVFKKLPLGKRKWQLRFVNTASDRLDPRIDVAFQVRTHRLLSEGSAELLTEMLGREVASGERERRFLEGEKRAVTMARTVRNVALRLAAKNHWGPRCYCCGFSFQEFYGAVGKDFAIIHHVEPLGGSEDQSRETSVEDVRVVCANCHCILHRQDPPRPVEELRRQILRRWTGWSASGIRTR